MERHYTEELSPWEDKHDTVINLLQLDSKEKRCEVRIRNRKIAENSFKTMNNIHINSPKIVASTLSSHKQISSANSSSLFHNSRLRTEMTENIDMFKQEDNYGRKK